MFDKKTRSGLKANVDEVLDELHKSVMKKFKTRKVYSRSKCNIWTADLTEIGSLSPKNWGVKYLLCVIDVFAKYAWVKPFKDKKVKTVLNGFTVIVCES